MVTRELEAEGVEPSSDPIGNYLSLVAEVTRFKDILRARSAELEDPEWVTRSKLGVEEVAAILRAYERALDRCERTLSNMLKLDLEARRVAIAERDALAISDAFTAALIAMGLQDRLEQFREHFHASYGRSLPAGSPTGD
jgi:hypothetical protein